jgi:hypothetical protein
MLRGSYSYSNQIRRYEVMERTLNEKCNDTKRMRDGQVTRGGEKRGEEKNVGEEKIERARRRCRALI